MHVVLAVIVAVVLVPVFWALSNWGMSGHFGGFKSNPNRMAYLDRKRDRNQSGETNP